MCDGHVLDCMLLSCWFFADVTDPVGDVLSFIRLYEEKYGLGHPVFYQGTYSQALNDAKQELRFLLVYLHCEEHQDTTNFCRWGIYFLTLHFGLLPEWVSGHMSDVCFFLITFEQIGHFQFSWNTSIVQYQVSKIS